MSYVDRIRAFQSRPSWQREANEALDRLGPISGMDALDFGCGTGALTEMLRARRAVALGYDPDPAMVAAAGAISSPAYFSTRTTSSARLPYPHRSFDLIVASHVLQHVEDLDETLIELTRIARVGARLLVLNPNWWNWLARLPINAVTGYRSDPTAIRSLTVRRLASRAWMMRWETEQVWHFGERAYGLPIDGLRSRFGMILRKSGGGLW